MRSFAKGIVASVFLATLFVSGYVYGVQALDTLAWPAQDIVRSKKRLSNWVKGVQYDSERLLNYSGKVPLDCPQQSASVGVFFVVGQSNAANYQGQRHIGRDGAINYVDGKCFKAASPLLGASGTSGESWTLLANKLIDAGVYEKVIIAPVSIGGSEIGRWSNGDLSEMLSRTGADLAAHYQVTAVLFHQGESDFNKGTSSPDYSRRLVDTLARIKASGVSAPVYLSVASFDTPDRWRADNAVATAQLNLIQKGVGMAGPDTDSLVTFDDRYDGVHFGASGQEKFATAWLEILRTHSGTPGLLEKSGNDPDRLAEASAVRRDAGVEVDLGFDGTATH